MTNEEALKMTLEQCEYFKQRYISRKGVGCDNNDGCKDCYANFVIKSLEKQIAKKPIEVKGMTACPNCNCDRIFLDRFYRKENCCPVCGQHIDWNGYRSVYE